MFLRDCKQAEILLGEQENFLNKESIPVSVCCFMIVEFWCTGLLQLNHECPQIDLKSKMILTSS